MSNRTPCQPSETCGPGHPEPEPEPAAGQRVQVAAVIAVMAGVRAGIWKTAAPTSIRSVCAATQASTVGGVGAVGLRGPDDAVAEPVGLLGQGEVVGVVAGAPVAEVQSESHPAERNVRPRRPDADRPSGSALACRTMEQRYARGGPACGSRRLGLGTMTWGRDTDEHEAAEQLEAFLDAGGTLLDTAAAYGEGAAEELLGTLLRDQVATATRSSSRTKAGISRRAGDADRRHLAPARCSRRSTRSWPGSAPTTWTCGWSTPGATRAARGDAVGAGLRGERGRARYVGISNYSGWQTAQAATWQQACPGAVPLVATQVEYSLLDRGVEVEVLPRRDGARARRARLVAARPRGADRQVPQRHAGRLAGAPRTTSRRSSSRTWTRARAQIVDAVARAADGLDCHRWRWRSLGPGPPGCHGSLLGARTAPSSRPRWPPRSSCCRTRSPQRWTTSRAGPTRLGPTRLPGLTQRVCPRARRRSFRIPRHNRRSPREPGSAPAAAGADPLTWGERVLIPTAQPTSCSTPAASSSTVRSARCASGTHRRG